MSARNGGTCLKVRKTMRNSGNRFQNEMLKTDSIASWAVFLSTAPDTSPVRPRTANMMRLTPRAGSAVHIMASRAPSR